VRGKDSASKRKSVISHYEGRGARGFPGGNESCGIAAGSMENPTKKGKGLFRNRLMLEGKCTCR